MSRNSTHINCNQVAGTVNQGIWKNDCDPCATSPYAIPNIKLWHRYGHDIVVGGTLRATPADILANVSDGDKVDQWKDQIGSNHAVQTTDADKPTWYATDKSLKFTTNEHYDLTSAVTYAAADEFTILLAYIQLNSVSIANETLYLGNSGNDYFKYVNDTTIEVSVGGTTQTITGPSISQTAYTNFVLRKDAAQNAQIFIEGLPWGASFLITSSFSISEYGATTDGYIAAHMQFDRALTDKEIWCLDCYNSNQDDNAEPVTCRIDMSKLACNGDTTGSLTAHMANAVGTVTYLWNTGSPAATTQTVNNLGAGTYTCTMTDSASPANVTTCTATLVDPVDMTCTVVGVNPAYNASTLVPGSVSASVVGGTGPLTYAWTLNGSAISPNPGSVASFNVSTAGTYAVTVTDAQGCTTTCSVVISVPNVPSELDIECCYEAPKCNDQEVQWAIMLDSTATFPVTISPTGSVSGAQSAITVSSLPTASSINSSLYDLFSCTSAGNWYYAQSGQFVAPGETWTFVVADSSSPQRSQTCTVTLQNPPALGITKSVTQPTICENGGLGSNGQISFVGVAGTPPYTYQITNTTASPNIVYNTNLLNNPQALPTNYTLLVTDANGCTATQNVTLTCPITADINVTTVDISCTPVATELTGPNPPLPCDGTATFTASPTSVTGYTFELHVFDQSGATIQTYGPSATFSAQTLTGLCVGTYTWEYFANNNSTGVQTTVDNGTFDIFAPAALSGSFTSVTYPTCQGSSNGSITQATPTGGTAPYTYSWSASNGGVVPSSPNQSTNQSLTGLVAGCYTCIVTDARGCTLTLTQCIHDGCNPTIYGYAGTLDCIGDTTDVIVNTPYCGLPPFTWAWTASNGGTIPSGQAALQNLTGVGPGTYTVTVSDSNSPACTGTATVNVAAGTALTGSITGTNVNCKGERTGAATFDQYNDAVYSGATYQWFTNSGYSVPLANALGGNTHHAHTLQAGTYYLQVTASNGCIWQGSIVITEPSTGMNLSAVVTDENQCTDCCGAIDLTVTGGTAPYTYQWNDPQASTTEDLSCVSAGSYTVIVTDASGCTATDTYTVGITSYQLIVTLGIINIATAPQLVANVSGGQPGYYYQWTLDGNPHSYQASPLTAGNGLYCLTVTDAEGCTGTACIPFTMERALQSYNCVTNAAGNVGCVGVTGTGGTYATYAACVEACQNERPVRYRCAEGTGCIQHPGGNFTTLAACQAVCGDTGGTNINWVCEILCPGAAAAEKYKSDRSEEDREYGHDGKVRQREDVTTGGGKCREENPSTDGALTKYTTFRNCIENCPFCKEGFEYS